MMLFTKTENLVDRLQNGAKSFPHRLACLYLADGQEETARITYDELNKKAQSIAAFLQRKQLFQQRVILLYPIGLDFICAFMACLYAGVIAVPVHCPPINELEKNKKFIQMIAINADIAGILTDEKYLKEIETCFSELIETKKIFIANTTNLNVDIASIYQIPILEENTTAYLQYTSGSTATPKGVIISHKNLSHSLKNTVKIWRYSKHSVTLNWAPHSHVYGLMCGLLMPLYHGTPAILMSPQSFIRRPLSWLEAITKYRVTHTGCPNFGYQLCVDDIADTDIKTLDLRYWQMAINGGEQVRYETLKKFHDKFSKWGFSLKQFCPAYGMSELTGLIASNVFKKIPQIFDLNTEELKNNRVVIADSQTLSTKFISDGYLLPGLQAKIVDPETLEEVSSGNIGEIWLSGDSVAMGYWKREEETKTLFHAKLTNDQDNYFRTGDLGFLIHGNEICVTGRLKELIIIYGKNYYPSDLESVAAQVYEGLSKTNTTVVFSLPGEEKEKIILLQEISPNLMDGEHFDSKKIIQAIQQTIAQKFGIELNTVLFIEAGSLPRAPSGKIQRKLCRERFLEGKLQSLEKLYVQMQPFFSTQKEELVTDDILLRKIQQDLIDLIASLLKIENTAVDLNVHLSDYGFDSIDVTRLVDLLQRKYTIHLTPAILYEYMTLMEFCTDLSVKYKDIFLSYYQLKAQNEILYDDSKSTLVVPVVDERDFLPIAVIGMAGIFPQATDINQFCENLLQGKDGVTTIAEDRFNLKADNDLEHQWGGFIENISEFDAEFFNISRHEAELIDPQQRLLLQTVWHVIEDAGYAVQDLKNQKIGVFIGASTQDYAELVQKNNLIDAYITTGVTHSILANRISYLLNLRGVSEVVDAACAGSLVAVHNAINSIRNGDCDLAIAGGVNALLAPSLYLAFSKAGMLSKTGACKTFDKNADGYVRSEGVAAILLKPLDKAKSDGDHIYGVIKGSAVNHGGHVSSLSVPNPNAQAEVIAEAHRRAGIPIDTVTYIETHGTGTALGDPIEINGLKKAFTILQKEQDKKDLKNAYCGLGAVKTNVGHLEAAAGITGLIKVLLALQQGQLPGNLHFQELNPYIEINETPFYIVDKTQPWIPLKDSEGNTIPRRAGVSSFGFGGTNAHVVIEEYLPSKITEKESAISQCVIALSAKTEQALQQRISDLQTWLFQQTKPVSLAALSYTLNVGRDHFNKRCIFIVESLTKLKTTLQQLQEGKKPDNFILYTDSTHIATENFSQEELYTMTSELSFVEYRNRLLQLGYLYVKGHEIDWKRLPFYKTKTRLSLPGYPFAKEHYWISDTKSISIEPFKEVSIQLPSSESLSIVNETPTKIAYSESKLFTYIQQDLIQHAAAILKANPSTLSLIKSLYEFGFDSIGLKQLTAQLENHYKIPLNPALFFTNNTIQALSVYFEKNYTDELMKFYFEEKQKWPERTSFENLVPQDSGTRFSNEVLFSSSQNFQIKTTLHVEPIAIIGIQGTFPQSEDVKTFWQHLEAGNDLITEIPAERWNWRDYYGDAKEDPTKTNSKWGGFIPDFDKFDASFFNLSAREANLMDPQHRLFLETVWRTIEDAGYDPFSLSKKIVGVFAGVEFSEYQTLVYEKKNLLHGYVATGNSHSLLANRVSYFLNLQGPSETVDTACSSALVAVHRAITALRNQECEMAIAGGVSLILNPQTYVITSQLGALSPDGRCKTFDKSANGYVKGEGVAAILLKPLQQALRDGDHIYAIIKGSAVNHGGKAQSLTAPNTSAQSQLIVKAHTQAGVDPETITYIETHGTGTELGDPIEIEALKQAFNALFEAKQKNKKQKAYCALGSVKTNIGHLEPASGIASVIKILLAMQHGKIPRNLHCREINPYIQLNETPFFLADILQDWHHLKDEQGEKIPRRAGVSSFGFGGTNAHLVLEEAQPMIVEKKVKKPFYLISLSAKQEASLKKKIVDLYDWLKNNISTTDLADLSFTLNAGRSHFNFRCAMIVNSLEHLLETLQKIIQDKNSENVIENKGKNFDSSSPVFHEIHKITMADLKNYRELTPEIYREKLFLIADLYSKHYAFIDWDTLYVNESIQRISGLPTYPFIKQRYWFDLELQIPEKIKQTEIKPLVRSSTNQVSEKIKSQDLTAFTLEYLKQIFAEKLRLSPEKIAIDETYEVYGVDSLLGLEIINRLEKDLGTLPKTLLYEKNQLQELAECFQKKFPSQMQKLLCHYEEAEGQRGNLAKLSQGVEYQNREEIQPFVMTEKNKDIAIIGLSGVYPLANNIREFWKNLETGRDCITEIPADRWDYKDYPITVGSEKKYYQYGGFIPDIDKFDPLFFNISPNEAALMDPQERLFMQSAWSTLEDAGYTRERLKSKINNQLGVFVGVTYNFYPLFIAEEWSKGNYLPLDIQMFSLANRVSYFLNASGPSYPIDTACSSSLAAIHLACESIQRGECIMAIAGGVNLSLHPAKYHMLGSYSFMADSGRCTSFAADGNGYVPAEGFGSVLLKPLSLAERDGDHIYAVIKSTTVNHGGKTSGYTVPNPNAQAELIKKALEKSGIDPRTITYIEAHGTGTALGDPIEIRGLQEAFSHFTNDKQFCAIGSVKSNIGHLESAAGISQLTKVILQLQHKKLVPSLHAEKLNPYIDFEQTPFFVQKKLSDWNTVSDQLRRAGISSFGAGGTNVHVILEEYNLSVDKKNNFIALPFIFLLSALNKERLQEYANQMYLFLEKEIKSYSDKTAWLHNVCYTTQIGREAMATRLAILATSHEDLLKKLQRYATDESITAGIWIGQAEPTNKLPISLQEIKELIQQEDYIEVLSAWSKGSKVNWEELYSDQKPHCISLPTYPFAKRRCWIPTKTPKKNVESIDTSITIPEKIAANNGAHIDQKDYLYFTTWQEQSLENKSFTKKETWLIFSDKTLGFHLYDELGKENNLLVFSGEKFQSLNNNVFYINPAQAEDYEKLLEIINSQNKSIKGIIYLWAQTPEMIETQQSFYLLHFLQALLKQKWSLKLRISLVTRGGQWVTDDDSIQIWQHHLWALLRIFSAEQPNYEAMLLDLSSKKSLRREAKLIVNELYQYRSEEMHIAYRNEKRYVMRLTHNIKNDTPSRILKKPIPEVALITGGLGGLGLAIAQWLVQQGTKYLLLTGRAILPEREHWDSISDKMLKEKIQSILDLEKANVKVIYGAVDICEKKQMGTFIQKFEEKWQKKIEGVFHLAGVETDNISIEKVTDKVFQAVLSPKVQGALVLHELFNTKDLNCFVLFSSVASVPYFGLSGLSAYATANAFLDGLAVYRQQQGLSGLSINWVAWSERGMSFRHNHDAFLETMGMSSLTIKQGTEILYELLKSNISNTIILKIDWKKFLQINPDARRLPFFCEFKKQYGVEVKTKNISIKLDEKQMLGLLTEILAKIIGLEPTEIDIETPFQNYGLDSINGINFVAELSQQFPDILSPMDLYRYPSVKQLSTYLIQVIQPEVEEASEEKQKMPLPDEKIFLAQISHLKEEEMNQLIEEELAGIEELL